MKVIDSDNYLASGIETFFFPGGEPHARIPENFGESNGRFKVQHTLADIRRRLRS